MTYSRSRSGLDSRLSLILYDFLQPSFCSFFNDLLNTIEPTRTMFTLYIRQYCVTIIKSVNYRPMFLDSSKRMFSVLACLGGRRWNAASSNNNNRWIVGYSARRTPNAVNFQQFQTDTSTYFTCLRWSLSLEASLLRKAFACG